MCLIASFFFKHSRGLLNKQRFLIAYFFGSTVYSSLASVTMGAVSAKDGTSIETRIMET